MKTLKPFELQKEPTGGVWLFCEPPAGYAHAQHFKSENDAYDWLAAHRYILYL